MKRPRTIHESQGYGPNQSDKAFLGIISDQLDAILVALQELVENGRHG